MEVERESGASVHPYHQPKQNRIPKNAKDKQISLDQVLKESCSVGVACTDVDEALGMSVFPSIPLSAVKVDQSFIRYSHQFARTLMIGKDLLDETDICRGGVENLKTMRDILLNEQIESLNSLQRCAWPHITRGRDCVILGGTNPKKGKSVAYLAPLAQLSKTQLESFRADENQSLAGPIGLILCSTWKSCHKVGGMLSKLIAGTYLKLLTIGDHNDREERKRLEANTDFVVTTPVGAVELFSHAFDKFQFERLRFLVVDDTQHIFRSQLESFTFLIEKIHNFRGKVKQAKPLQTIFCGTEWNETVASASLYICNDAVLIIESSMASIQYGKIETKVHYFEYTNEKMSSVLSICEGFPEGSRIIIVCVKSITTEDIRVKLVRTSGISNTHTLTDEGGDLDKVREKTRQLKRLWDTAGRQKVVLVVTDEVLKGLGIVNAQYIIHFDLPLKRKEAFADRHMCMWENYPRVMEYNVRGNDALNSRVPLESHVFITSEDHEFEKIVQRLHDIQVDIPEELLMHAKAEVDKNSLQKELCLGFTAYGRCISTEPCTRRHRFTKDEILKEPTVPQMGRIYVELVEMIDVTTHWARLINYYDVADGKKVGLIKYNNRAKELQDDLNSYFSHAENRINCTKLKVGMHCVIQDTENAFLRGQICLVLDDHYEDGSYRIFSVDIGKRFVRKPKEMFILPEFLSVDRVSPFCVTLYLAGIKPYGNEPCFSVKAKRAASHENLVKYHKFTGKIVLSIGNSVWVNSLIEHKECPNGELIPILNLRVEFTKALHYGEWNPDHMELLYQSCERDGGMNCDKYRAVDIIGGDLDQLFFRREEHAEWAFLPTILNSSSTSIPRIMAWCSYYNSVYELYVQRDDRLDLLDILLDEMDSDINAMIGGKYEKYPTLFEAYYEVGLPVAAFESVDKKWNRGIIVKKDIIDNEPAFDIFFVDHGDLAVEVRMDEMFPLKTEFVTKLPFQAIRVGLEHILPLEGSLSEEVNEKAKTYFIKDGISQPLEMMVKTKEKNHEVNGIQLCKSYDCMILESVSGNEIGEILEQQSLATVDSEGKEKIREWKKLLLKHYNKVLDEAVEPNEDEDSDEDGSNYKMDLGNDDDFDVFLGVDECSTADEKAQVATKILNDFGLLQPIENSARTYVGRHKEVIEGSQSSISNGPLNADGENMKTSTSEPESPPDGPVSDVPQLRKPRVEWKQTPEFIILWIHIPDLGFYTLEVQRDSNNRDHIVFNCDQPTQYGFELALVGNIRHDVFENWTGQYLCVKYKKLSKKMRWPYLLVGNASYHWLKRRLDERTLEGDEERGYTTSEDEINIIRMLWLKRPVRSNRFIPAGNEDSESESENTLPDQIVSDEDEEVGAGYEMN